MITKIETASDLLQWAVDINNGRDRREVCDLQDIYARTPTDSLNNFFLDLKSARSLIICVINRIMGWDEVYRLIKFWAKDVVDKAFEKGYSTLEAKEKIFEESKKPFFKKLAKLRVKVAWMEKALEVRNRNIDDLNRDIAYYSNLAKGYQKKAAKYDALIKLLKEE